MIYLCPFLQKKKKNGIYKNCCTILTKYFVHFIKYNIL